MVFAEAGEFAMVIVAGVGAGESKSIGTVDGEVELGSEFEVDDLSGIAITEEIVEFADGAVNVPAKLEAFFEEAQ